MYICPGVFAKGEERCGLIGASVPAAVLEGKTSAAITKPRDGLLGFGWDLFFLEFGQGQPVRQVLVVK
jgi:inosine/xanthosine triphosphate pyrophosphatase family protein